MVDPLILAAEHIGRALGSTSQPDLLAARQMQAMSFVVHIPLVCFGIAFPTTVLFAEGLRLRTGDPAYKALAKRWSKVTMILFAVGVVTGTILSFEFGLLWPNLTATFGNAFGLGFAIEGFSFFIEAIFIAIYVYGWDRLSDRLHFLTGIPIAVAGVTGSLSVNLRQCLDEPPERVRRRRRQGDQRRSLDGALQRSPMVRAHAHVLGRVHGRRLPRSRCLCGRLAEGRTRSLPSRRSDHRPHGETTEGASLHLGGIYEEGGVKYGIGIPKMLSPLVP
jgi:cytochrome bd ubiquinol oxidase subunit I